MSIPRGEPHRPIDRLSESPAVPIPALVRGSTLTGNDGDEWLLSDFVGALASGTGGLAARSSEILRAELRREPGRSSPSYLSD